MRMLDGSVQDAIPIVPAPFEDDGEISLRSVDALIGYYESCGITVDAEKIRPALLPV